MALQKRRLTEQLAEHFKLPVEDILELKLELEATGLREHIKLTLKLADRTARMSDVRFEEYRLGPEGEVIRPQALMTAKDDEGQRPVGNDDPHDPRPENEPRRENETADERWRRLSR